MEAKPIEYIWDDLDVGKDDNDIQKLENFFSKRHYSHERRDNCIKVETKADLDEKVISNKENLKNEHNQDKLCYNKKNIKTGIISPSRMKVKTPEKRTLPNLMKKPWNSESAIPENNARKAKCVAKIEPPSAYEFKDTYQKKKEEKLKQMLIEEKKNREFRSRPVPNFCVQHENKSKKESSIPTKITAPVTPKVLKKSAEILGLRKQKIEEYKKNNLPKQFVSNEPLVLHHEPFKPKVHHHEIQPKPFNLNVEKRLEDRKTYDLHIRRIREEKSKLAERNRIKQDKEMNKEYRKLTNFKARPNPFK